MKSGTCFMRRRSSRSSSNWTTVAASPSNTVKDENCSGVFGRPRYLGAAFVDQGGIPRGADCLLRQHWPGGGTAGPRKEGPQHRRVEDLYRRFAGRVRARLYFSDDSGGRDL